MHKPVIPHDDLRSILRSFGCECDGAMHRMALRVEQEVLHRVAEQRREPLAEHEAEFIQNVRTVVAGIRESIIAEERERLARALPEWLRKGSAS